MDALDRPLHVAVTIDAWTLVLVLAVGAVIATVIYLRTRPERRWPCPDCGRSTCDRRCVERGDD